MTQSTNAFPFIRIKTHKKTKLFANDNIFMNKIK